MKPNELKLWNYVLNNEGIVSKIILVGETLVMVDNSQKVNEINVAPIPLTEEWLLKLGFELKTQNMFACYATPNGFTIYVWTGSHQVSGFEEQGVSYYGENFMPVRTVHQLQNLHFSLTSEELTIKES